MRRIKWLILHWQVKRLKKKIERLSRKKIEKVDEQLRMIAYAKRQVNKNKFPDDNCFV